MARWAESYNDDDEADYYEEFAQPGGNSALRAASASNPRNLPCPDCGTENVLTPADRAAGYCCNACANHNEGNGPNGAGEY